MTEIFRIVNGSKLYGLDTPESDDDFVAVYVETPETVFSGSHRKSKRYGSGTKKTQPGEEDGIAYSLRHYFALALQGNPSVLAVLFAPESMVISSYVSDDSWPFDPAKMIRENARLFVSMQAAPRFLGYMKNQLDRLTGARTGHIPNRPELVDKYGYDVKYAAQAARLASQGIEYFTMGKITSPMHDTARNECRDIRAGIYTYDEAIDLLLSLEDKLKASIEESNLPEHPDDGTVWKLSRIIHETIWSSTPCADAGCR